MNEIDSINPLGPFSRGALRHHVVQRLLKAIIQGELAAGTRLITNRLAVRLGVSATQFARPWWSFSNRASSSYCTTAGLGETIRPQ